jgi:mannan endo-1,4-beta-mannosidase
MQTKHLLSLGALVIGLVACEGPEVPNPAARAGDPASRTGTAPPPAAPPSTTGTSPAGEAPAPGPVPTGAPTHDTYYVSGADLFDRCGEKIVLRGINKMAVYLDRAGASFPEIAKTGANAVRFMWLSAVAANEAEAALQSAIDAQLVPIWELHDATGDFSKMNVVEAFWTSPATLATLAKFEGDVIVNIANEAGQGVVDADYVATYARIIGKLRTAGIRSPLMIDAAGYGRNVEQLLAQGPALVAADPLKNVLLSWHLYDAGTAQLGRIDTQLANARTQGLPLVVGELGPVEPGNCSSPVEYRHLMSKAQELGVGYLAWSWDNVNYNCGAPEADSPMNMVSDGIHASTLRSGFGSTVVDTDPAGIRKTSKRGRWAQKRSCL